ncbi:MAG: tRNA lysidine(34) synthetase TilS [Lachnospiraceae bacterium]|nr:tRNA lysidine(34) synthetase TilS [Lachnospiraceae bacterium]
MNERYYELEQRVMAYCRAQGLFTPGDGVVLGVSGGADSVCLLFSLHRLRRELGIRLYVVHVNHGIRPDAARDGAYVEDLCRRLEVPYTLVEEDVQALARRHRCSTEEAGRQVRYEAFDREMERRQARKVAVAHNAGDRAETMLFHLFRGTGLAGLGSIRPVRGRVVRPLLGLERREIEAYLEQRGITYCRDSTNESDAYTRNRIRRHILPYAEREVCMGATAHLCRTADIFMEIEDYMEEQTRQAERLCLARENASRLVIHVPAFGELHPALQKGLLLSALKELSPAHRDMGAGQVSQVLELWMQPGNREIHLPQGIRAARSYDRIILERRQTEEAGAAEPFALPVPLPGTLGESRVCEVPGGFLRLTRWEKKDLCDKKILDRDSYEKSMNLLENQYTKWLDCDRMEELLEWRTRRAGDYLEIRTSAGPGRKTVKSLFIDGKVPREERDGIPLLAQGSHVLWVAGGRICESCKIGDGTRQILQVEYERL